MDRGATAAEADSGLLHAAGDHHSFGREGGASGSEGRGQVSERAVDGGSAGHARVRSELSDQKEAT